jgi:PsbP-like protein
MELLSSSRLRNVRLSTIIIASAVVSTFLFLPLTASINNGTLFQSQSAFAQVQQQGGGELGTTNTTQTNDTTTTTGEFQTFLRYRNPVWGISIQYPSDWKASTTGLLDYSQLVAFYSPLQNLSQPFPARLTISAVQFNQNLSLSESTDFILTALRIQPELDIKNSSEVTVAGYPGYRVILANTPFQNNTLTVYNMNIWTTVGNKLYILTYDAEESTFNQYLPEVSRMLESLRITSNNNNNSSVTE